MGEVFGACTTLATGWPGIAVPPGSAHSPWGVNTQIKVNTLPCSLLKAMPWFMSEPHYCVKLIVVITYNNASCVMVKHVVR